MLRFIVNRLLLALPTLWAVLTLLFVLVRVVPGDPTIVVLGDQASPAARAASISLSATSQCEKFVTAVGVPTIEREWKNWVSGTSATGKRAAV